MSGAVVAVCALAAWAVVASREARERTAQLARHVALQTRLQEAIEQLTAALARQAGQPVIFQRPEKRPTEGWFDGKPRLGA